MPDREEGLNALWSCWEQDSSSSDKCQQVERESSGLSGNKTSGGLRPSQNHSGGAKAPGGEIPFRQYNKMAGLRPKLWPGQSQGPVRRNGMEASPE